MKSHAKLSLRRWCSLAVRKVSIVQRLNCLAPRRGLCKLGSCLLSSHFPLPWDPLGRLYGSSPLTHCLTVRRDLATTVWAEVTACQFTAEGWRHTERFCWTDLLLLPSSTERTIWPAGVSLNPGPEEKTRGSDWGLPAGSRAQTLAGDRDMSCEEKWDWLLWAPEILRSIFTWHYHIKNRWKQRKD